MICAGMGGGGGHHRINCITAKTGAPGAIPTRDLPLRRRTLYATELREPERQEYRKQETGDRRQEQGPTTVYCILTTVSCFTIDI